MLAVWRLGTSNWRRAKEGWERGSLTTLNRHIWEEFYCGCLENCGNISIGDKFRVARVFKFVKLSL